MANVSVNPAGAPLTEQMPSPDMTTEVNSVEAPLTEQVPSPEITTEENSVEVGETHPQKSDDVHVLAEELKSQGDGEVVSQDNVSGTEVLDRGVMEHGCSHYRRRCRIRAPCCNEIFDCRHCHNEAKNNLNNFDNLKAYLDLAHDVPRYQIEKVICSLCDTEQEVRQVCINCGVCMGRFFCGLCKLYDDDTSKEQFHCTGCGLCRLGGRENYFHCDGCGCCYVNALKDNHTCVAGVLHRDCPVCYEYLFESRFGVCILRCGHAIHTDCFKQMRDHYQYACPVCSKSMCDMSRVWTLLDLQIARCPVPEAYRQKIRILCNDCEANSEVRFHWVGNKCPSCKSYNTRQT